MNKRALIVDDDLVILKLLTKILKDINIDSVPVDSVKSAVEALKNDSFDLVIVDYQLVNGKGTEIITESRMKDLSVPIIMISGGDDEVKIASLNVGANFYLKKPFDNKELKSIVVNLLTLAEAYDNLDRANSTILALEKAIEYRDTYTVGHSQRVSTYALTIYYLAGYENEEEKKQLSIGCLLHDIGKIGISDTILNSPNKLDEKQREVVEKHPAIGLGIISDIKKLQFAFPIIRNHHEKLDGSGYPDKLRGSEISNLIQIVTIADIFDALTSNRSYRNQNSAIDALNIMQNEADEGKLNKDYFNLLKSLYK